MIASAPYRPWLVQKYGGTSVGKLLDAITDSIIPAYVKDYNLAVVCSARSASKKAAGTTSLLLKALECAVSNEISMTACNQVIETIKQEHLSASILLEHSDMSDEARHILQTLRYKIQEETEALKRFLCATWTIGEVSDRTQDKVLGVGEKLSCLVVAAALSVKGRPAEVVNLENIVQAADSRSVREQKAAYKQNPVTFLQNLRDAVRTKVLACCAEGNVPIITGFFGSMPNSLINTVGRGYSDLCAALCAISLDAEELQIWKEVDGIFTADPTKVSTARVLPTVTSEEAAELTYYGSEVIHTLTMSLLSEEGVSLRLKNVKNPSGAGTIIYPTRKSPSSSPARSASSTNLEAQRLLLMATNGYHGDKQAKRAPTAITAKESITLINITSNGRLPPQAFLGQSIDILGRHQVALDLTSSSHRSLSLALSSKTGAAELAEAVSEALPELEEFGTTTVMPKMSIISVVGHKMKNMVGIAAEIFTALAGARINIYLISQGASEINISFVVRAQDTLLAMEVVHTKVMRIPGHAEKEMSFIRGPWLY
ncbi:Aspartokinase [Elasticomyces elasticus]|uniref:Aspartokinase n=1 Tax=Exophiala sideris TaxID=1016849 RepID=A0ABR0IVH0_9EURO|nr:Aspartokinase [Elasticomyces elasticus]KAK5021454.1 Aspartokinase [Exophiala sideris]KAK5024522.1 Aspartokinase [Exophiala sideris]KAK5049586.1 Aspartokinase [Exophiala sideris]KAK5176619.1 Aspartokinase [Eurotiomycetes sp. CCFEE 6388]